MENKNNRSGGWNLVVGCHFIISALHYPGRTRWPPCPYKKHVVTDDRMGSPVGVLVKEEMREKNWS